jgi:hypothetical protein
MEFPTCTTNAAGGSSKESRSPRCETRESKHQSPKVQRCDAASSFRSTTSVSSRRTSSVSNRPQLPHQSLPTPCHPPSLIPSPGTFRFRALPMSPNRSIRLANLNPTRSASLSYRHPPFPPPPKTQAAHFRNPNLSTAAPHPRIDCM